MDNTEKSIPPQDDMKDGDLSAGPSETEETLEPEEPKEVAPQKAPGAQEQISEMTDRLQRAMADFDNYRKRTLKERIGMQAEGVRHTVEKLLPVVDNFERAMEASSAPVFSPAEKPAEAAEGLPPVPDGSFVVGMHMILKQLHDTLKDEIGVCEIPAIGEDFDPEVHFAVSHIDDEQYESNKVIEVLQKGYQYKDKVIRPSMVRVAN